MLNGILVIDKDKGMTSADVVYHLRRVLHIRKIGHAGTLDPEVTGVLPIAIGQATKLIEMMHTRPKEYIGTGLFGYSTDSYDATGTVLKEKKLIQPFSGAEIQENMNKFVGEIVQVPPIYSAVKVNGKHLYEYAREEIEVERPQRKVEVKQYDLTKEPVFDINTGQESFDFKIKCSKGTYVRSLVNDLGEKLDCPATMTYLRRTASSGFDITQAVKLKEIEENPKKATELIQPIDAFFKEYTQVDLTEEKWLKVKNGAGISLETNAKKVALLYNKKVKAIYEKKGKLYRPSLMLLQNE
ncbi:tRNA pseudouridine(55) synthase TruB [Lactobacillus crispatus]|uniref:tRNA pseudouridine(55) synthase TruB n=1 Tax=Lactobacillus crispatus TaxID=47770 RepID=UPI0022AC8999|nr:tRNA pseudouridine(55) synthase TruB [Lactobacillus crispatus]MCZ3862438.1 tRNA pseudouridine(55) synthase TruB [Lactobacillus crispatus]MCZ3920539.1 tRNA pseudouridine(55) synthase TruB [Lactobacillus crispatus]MCZ3981757.1 tRNA pseudouridine(55) synthase TruB [Lactobacillus crispatus]MCZ4000043.1 tRNA pseudouridine(55) synthase TruB [Lactobacillus crispatus]MCZ4028629.1 tRNA pseudouridine(55) synthase TruB [Lactobacillus crispatus]